MTYSDFDLQLRKPAQLGGVMRRQGELEEGVVNWAMLSRRLRRQRNFILASQSPLRWNKAETLQWWEGSDQSKESSMSHFLRRQIEPREETQPYHPNLPSSRMIVASLFQCCPHRSQLTTASSR